jgi:hypothetical protein
VLYLHDLLDHPITLDYVSEEDLDELGVYSVPAIEYLTSDDGRRLPDLPPAIDISTLDGDVIWRRENTPSHMLLASAMDVAARTTAEASDARNDSKASTSFGSLRPDTKRAMLGSIYAPSQDKLWADPFWNSVEAAIAYNPRKVLTCHHTDPTCLTFSVRAANAERRTQYSHACNRGGGGQTVNQAEYVFGQASSFGQLPYVIQRVCIFKAIIEKDERCGRILMWA